MPRSVDVPVASPSMPVALLLVAVFVSLQEHICVVTVWPGKFSHVACLAPECIQYDHMKLTQPIRLNEFS